MTGTSPPPTADRRPPAPYDDTARAESTTPYRLHRSRTEPNED
ncbi:hypothetical protein [Streptomyces sp. NBC_01506]